MTDSPISPFHGVRDGDQPSSPVPNLSFAISELKTMLEVGELANLLGDIWGSADTAPSANLLRALSVSGNYVAGASVDGQLVGGLVGFFGQTGAQDLHLHSQILGVRPQYERQGVGFALKQHQRKWALDRQINEIAWTFDPLVSRNGYFNVHKLGADVREYYENFYGVMADGLNGVGATDRVLVVWRLKSERAEYALRGGHAEAAVDPSEANGAVVALEPSDHGEPRVAAVAGDTILCRVPDDIVAIRRSDAGCAERWRLALRETFGAAIKRGWNVADMTRTGSYVLRR